MKNRITFVLLLTASGAMSQSIAWQQSLGGSMTDAAFRSALTNDGGFIVAGFTNSADGDIATNRGGSDGFLIRLSASGTVTWKKTFGGSGFD